MSKSIEADIKALANMKTFVKFWTVPLGILLVMIFLASAEKGLIIVGASIFLALALRPLVKAVNNFFLKQFGANKKFGTLSVVLAYLIVVVVIGGIVAIIGPVVVSETSKFIQNFPQTFEEKLGGWDGINSFGRNIGIDNLQNEIDNSMKNLSEQITSVFREDFVASVSGIANGVMSVVLVLILALLFLLEGPGLLEKVWHKIEQAEDNVKKVEVARRVVSRMADVVSTYVSKQALVALIDGLVVCLIVFILSLCTKISMGLALPMGLITMVFYMIPMFGQFIGGTLVTLILLLTNPIAAVIFAVIYIIYSQFENNLLSPKIQGDALRLPAVIILCAVVIGMYVAGLLGAIIAIPITGCVRVLVDEYANIKRASQA